MEIYVIDYENILAYGFALGFGQLRMKANQHKIAINLYFVLACSKIH